MEAEAKDAELRKRKASKTETEDKGSSSGGSSKKEVQGDASEEVLMANLLVQRLLGNML